MNHPQVEVGKNNREPSSANTGELSKVILIILSFSILLMFVIFILPTLLFLGALGFLSGSFDGMYIAINVVFCIGLCIAAYIITRRLQTYLRVFILLLTPIIAVLSCLAVLNYALPAYDQYRIDRAVSRMKVDLQSRYGKEFSITEPYKCSTTKFGSSSQVCAKAYVSKEPGAVYLVRENNDGSFTSTLQTN